MGVKQLRNVVMPRSTFSGRGSQVAIAREKAADWRVAQGRPRVTDSKKAAGVAQPP